MKKLLFIIAALSFTQYGIAQSKTARSIQLKDSTFDKSISFEVAKGTQLVTCSLNGHLTGGVLSVKFLDPEGKQEGGFGLAATGSDGGAIKPANGKMTKEVKLPIPGTWKLQIKTQQATGNIDYEIHFK